MDYALVILCGGNSTRMGSDKALLPFGDYCLIEYLVKKFTPCFTKIYLSVKRKGDYSHLNLPVTEIPDIYSNAGPMSGVFSALSMIDEECAFFMSVDTPFLEPKTGIALLDALGDSDICTIRGKAGYLETATAAYSKNCITTVGKCLLLHQHTFKALREKCSTKYLTEKAVANYIQTPIDIQFYNLDTRPDYYHSLRILSGISHPDSSNALIEYFNDNKDLFSQTVPVLSFVAKPGTACKPFIENLLLLLKKDNLDVIYLTVEDDNVTLHHPDFVIIPEELSTRFANSNLVLIEYTSASVPKSAVNKIEFLRRDWSEEPITSIEELLAVITDFPFETDDSIMVFDWNKPKTFLHFIREFLSNGIIRH